MLTRRAFAKGSAVTAAGLVGVPFLNACSSGTEGADVSQEGGTASSQAAQPTGPLVFDMNRWNYDADNGAWWQVGVVYCEKPEADAYESLGIYVPGAYLEGEPNGDGTYHCAIAENGAAVGGFSALTAPVVMPVNTAGYAAQPAPTSFNYQSVAEYLEAGLVYVYAGCRGRENGTNDDGTAFDGGAPWGVTDLKAAVRYLRYNAAVLPGNMAAIFSFGHSGGGAQSAVFGASGDSDLYTPYLERIGAAMADSAGAPLSDALAGSMCWCPITSLDAADAAYEWMMGQYSDEGTRADGLWTAQLSKDLAAAFGEYINDLELVGADGQALTLEPGDEGVYNEGTYYDFVLGAIEDSLNNFLADTTFPYTPSNSFMRDGGFGGAGADAGANAAGGRAGGFKGDLPEGELPEGDLPDGELPDLPEGAAAGGRGAGGRGAGGKGGGFKGDLPEGELPDGELPDLADGELPEGMDAGAIKGSSAGQADTTTYDTVEDYIASLNGDDPWITYDAATNTATVSSVGAFAVHCKQPSKDVGAFDDVNRAQGENYVFGNAENDALHFDALMEALLDENQGTYANLEGWDEAYVAAYRDDRQQLDSLGTAMDDRVNMYNPLYYVNEALGGLGTSAVAPHWRVHSGITQGDTSLTTELNLALELGACDAVEDIEFAAVWGQGHTMAERTGEATANFIAWVSEKAQ